MPFVVARVVAVAEHVAAVVTVVTAVAVAVEVGVGRCLLYFLFGPQPKRWRCKSNVMRRNKSDGGPCNNAALPAQ